MVNEIRGELTGISIEAGGVDISSHTLGDYEMTLHVKCDSTSYTKGFVDKDDLILYIPSLYANSTRSLIEVGRKYIFEVYFIDSQFILVDYTCMD
jgi:hypothetical protein